MKPQELYEIMSKIPLFKGFNIEEIEKILKKGRVQEARILFLLIAIWLGASIAKVIFDLSDYLNQYIQNVIQ